MATFAPTPSALQALDNLLSYLTQDIGDLTIIAEAAYQVESTVNTGRDPNLTDAIKAAAKTLDDAWDIVKDKLNELSVDLPYNDERVWSGLARDAILDL
jgi:hypothetical protein